MTPEYKFHTYITGLTVALMYLVITEIIPIFEGMHFGSISVQPVIAMLSTAGIYGTLQGILLKVSRNVNWFKKHLLGASYLNGTWIGKFTIENDEPILVVETFEQTISSLKIRGIAFHENGKMFAQWESVAESIKEREGVLTYTYSCTRNRDVYSIEGIAVFRFQRPDIHLPPTHLSGYSADLTDGIRNENSEKKVSDKLLPVGKAFEMAKKECLEGIQTL